MIYYPKRGRRGRIDNGLIAYSSAIGAFLGAIFLVVFNIRYKLNKEKSFRQEIDEKIFMRLVKIECIMQNTANNFLVFFACYHIVGYPS